jgi:hypothetical protein
MTVAEKEEVLKPLPATAVPLVLPVGESTIRSTICRQHREAVLGKVPVKGEGRRNTHPLHHRKACGIGEGKVFVCILVDNRLGTLYITRCDLYERCRAVFHVPEKSGGNRLA